TSTMIVIAGPEIAAYGCPEGHPFGPDRHDAFVAELDRSPAASRVERRRPPAASREEIEWFHAPEYVDRVIELSEHGRGFLDHGDTPAFPGVSQAASHAVGGTLAALAAVVAEGRPA